MLAPNGKLATSNELNFSKPFSVVNCERCDFHNQKFKQIGKVNIKEKIDTYKLKKVFYVIVQVQIAKINAKSKGKMFTVVDLLKANTKI